MFGALFYKYGAPDGALRALAPHRRSLDFGGGIVLGIDAVFAELVAEGADADAEKFRGVGAVLLGFLQHRQDVAFLDFGQRNRSFTRRGRRRGSCGGRTGGGSRGRV